MFRKNTTHLQRSFFDIENQLSESEEYSFYQLIFKKIKEENFAVLYSENGSRPNSAVNIMVSAIILAYRKGWTIKEMLKQIDFNLLTRTALGLNKMDDTAFCEATFFNFQNRLLKHFTETGENLLETLFDGLTNGGYGSEDNDQEFEKLEITHIQTAVRGRKNKVGMKIEETEGEYEVSCLPVRCTQTGPLQKVKSEKTRIRHKACFDKGCCDGCPFAGDCPTLFQNGQRVYYFTRKQYLANKRKRNINTLPLKRRKLRPNVEATIKEFVKPFNHKGELCIRGQFKTMMYACSIGISILIA